MAKLTPLKAIRRNCIDCSGGSYKEVTYCRAEDCFLHEYRHGKRPVSDRDRNKNKKNNSSEEA